MDVYPWRQVVFCGSLLLGCAKDRAAPDPPEAARPADRPSVDEETYVSTDDEEGDERDAMDEVVQADADRSEIEGDFAVRSPERALEIAEAAVAGELNPKMTWKPSPILPAKWPAEDKRVVYFFYPMSANPHDMSQFHLFSASYAVEVDLVDGTAEVSPISKRRKLAVIEDRRPSLLEREELELAENTLVRLVLAGETALGDNNLWGYLKYFHENPHFARDIKKRSPDFVRWVEAKKR